MMTCSFSRGFLKQDGLVNFSGTHEKTFKNCPSNNVDIKPRPALLLALNLFSNALKKFKFENENPSYREGGSV
jgi:hypothetical protein